MLTIKARAKINWALNIIGRRADGYHLLDMVMQSIDLCDDLSAEAAAELTLTVNGAAAGADNLVLRAATALNGHTGEKHGARLALKKRIPARAGLGGGSADCAAALVLLNELWALGLSMGELLKIGETLGADVPFCLTGGLGIVRGIGEAIEPVEPAPEIPLALVTPGGGLSTAAVFSLWDGGGFPPVQLDTRALARAVASRDLIRAGELCANALTAPAVQMMPEIGALIETMRRLGAKAAFMTGSGSTVVGAFDDPDDAARAAARIPGAVLTRTVPRQNGK